ncbi:MAG: LacI family DNA-binding transcriptional regulator [Dictyoglomaceae bacterium]
MVTLKDIALKAGVSKSTVSRVLNNKGNVNPTLKRKVKKIAKELGYYPNILAISLKKKRTYTIGVIISNILNPFFTSVVRGIEDTAMKNNFNIILCNADEDPKKEGVYIDLLRSKKVDGMIIATTGENKEHFSALEREKIPVVLVDRKVEGSNFDTIITDNKKGAFEAVKHFIETGYTRIGIITGPINITTSFERLEGYKLALKRYKIPFDEKLIKIGEFKEESGYKNMKELLKIKNPPKAIFAGNYLIALGVYDAIKEYGLKIPEDIAVITFDDFPWFKHLSPSLTAVSQPTYKLGAYAVKRLLKLIEEGIPYSTERKQIVLKNSLVIRESCGCKNNLS